MELFLAGHARTGAKIAVNWPDGEDDLGRAVNLAGRWVAAGVYKGGQLVSLAQHGIHAHHRAASARAVKADVTFAFLKVAGHLDKVKGAITKQMSNLKVACHPGCHYMRPVEWMESDDPMRPKNLKEIVAATGANVVDYDELALCCGNAVSGPFPEHGNAILKKKMDSVKKAGADVIVVNCPACFQRFDTSQRDLSKEFDTEYNVPVLYVTELIALAMGISSEDIGMKNHRVRRNTAIENL